MPDEKIKDCPFCGSQEVDVCRTHKHACWIQCHKCGADTPSATKREDAISIWNRRAGNKGYAVVVDDDEEN